MMNPESLTDLLATFFAMGGYASYVWGSFGLTFAIIAGNVIAEKRLRRHVLEEVSQLNQTASKRVSQPSLHDNPETISGEST